MVYTGEFDTLTREEVGLFAGAAQTPRTGDLPRAAFTGLRQGEILGLGWSDVDFVGGLLHVRRNYTDGRVKIRRASGSGVPMSRRWWRSRG